MTARELRDHFNTKYGLAEPWPTLFEVDAETYGYVLEAVLESRRREHLEWFDPSNIETLCISVGPNGGVMFKNVEIIIKKN
jgi:hypothetical protein